MSNIRKMMVVGAMVIVCLSGSGSLLETYKNEGAYSICSIEVPPVVSCDAGVCIGKPAGLLE